VRSLMRSRLVDSVSGKYMFLRRGKNKKYMKRGHTEEAKVASVNDCDGISLPGHVIERVESASDVCNTENAAME
jgi:hypothetical protein